MILRVLLIAVAVFAAVIVRAVLRDDGRLAYERAHPSQIEARP